MLCRTFSIWATTLFALSSALKVEKTTDFPLDSEVENLVIRPSGSVLAVVYTQPWLYQVEPVANATPKLIHTFSDTLGLSSIAHSSTPDVYHVITGNFTWKTFTPVNNSYAIHRVAFDKDDNVSVTQLAWLDGIEQPNGMIHVANTDDVLIADTRGGYIYRFNTKTSKLSLYFDHPMLKHPVQQCFMGACIEFGVNGIKLYNGYLYFSNTNQNLIARIKATGREIGCLEGEPEVVAKGISVDDFILNEQNGDIWIAENNDNAIGHLKASNYGGTPERVFGSGNMNITEPIGGPTAMRWAKGEEGKKLLVTVTGGFTQFFVGAFTGNYTGGGGITIMRLDE